MYSNFETQFAHYHVLNKEILLFVITFIIKIFAIFFMLLY